MVVLLVVSEMILFLNFDQSEASIVHCLKPDPQKNSNLVEDLYIIPSIGKKVGFFKCRTIKLLKTQYNRHSEKIFSRIRSVHVAGLVKVISHANGYFDICDIALRGNFGIYFQAHFYCKHHSFYVFFY